MSILPSFEITVDETTCFPQLELTIFGTTKIYIAKSFRFLPTYLHFPCKQLIHRILNNVGNIHKNEPTYIK